MYSQLITSGKSSKGSCAYAGELVRSDAPSIATDILRNVVIVRGGRYTIDRTPTARITRDRKVSRGMHPSGNQRLEVCRSMPPLGKKIVVDDDTILPGKGTFAGAWRRPRSPAFYARVKARRYSTATKGTVANAIGLASTTTIRPLGILLAVVRQVGSPCRHPMPDDRPERHSRASEPRLPRQGLRQPMALPQAPVRIRPRGRRSMRPRQYQG